MVRGDKLETLAGVLEFEEVHPLLLKVSKPYGFTSYSIVDLIKQVYKRPVGHGGTLDPLATGDLIVGVYPMTKRLTHFLNSSKQYEVLVLWGCYSDSYDLENSLKFVHDPQHYTNLEQPDNITKALRLLQLKKKIRIGGYSALKQSGRPFYTINKSKNKSNLWRYKENRLYQFEVIEHRHITAEEVVSLIGKKMELLESNYQSYQELGVKFNIRESQLKLFNKFLGVMAQHINVLQKLDDSTHLYITKMNLIVGKGTYVRYLVGELGNILDIPGVALEIHRHYLSK